MLRAARGLSLASALLLCLSFGFGDVSDARVLTALRAVMCCAIALGLLVTIIDRGAAPWRVAVPVLGWLCVLGFSALLAPTHREEALATLARPLTGVLLAVAVMTIAGLRRRWLLLCEATAAGGCVVALVGLAGVAGLPQVQQWLSELHDGPVPVADVPRLSSLLSHPNVAASVLELTLPLSVAAAVRGPSGLRVPLIVALLAQVLALSLTFSRAGILAAVISLALLAAIAARRGAREVLAPVGFAALAGPIGLGFAAATLPPVWHRMVAELEQAGYQATYVAPSVITVAADQEIEVPVTVTNASSSEWTALDASRVALGYHLLHADGTPVEFDCPATLLSADVPPRASLSLVAHLRGPTIPGLYLIEWDALREGVAWFSWRGSETSVSSLVVEPSASRPATAPESDQVAMPRPARIQYWLAAWSMLRDWPVLGVGPDNFRMRFADYSGSQESHIGTHAHSLYFESLADTGVVGFAALLAFVVALLRYAGSGLVADRDWLWRGALLASLASWLVHGLVDDFERFLPTHLAFWIVVGLAMGGARLAQRAQRTE